MAQRDSGYRRQRSDDYSTPPWVTDILVPYLPKRVKHVLEPAPGTGKMVRALERHHFRVYAPKLNFATDTVIVKDIDAIITNPPYGPRNTMSVAFIERSLKLMKPQRGVVAMLLTVDFDSAVTRQHLFGDCDQWCKKVILTKRILWFKSPDGRRHSSSTNHAWYIWDWKHNGPPTIAYSRKP